MGVEQQTVSAIGPASTRYRREKLSMVGSDLAETYPAHICCNLGHAASEEGVHIPIASMTDRVVAGAQLNPRLFVTDI